MNPFFAIWGLNVGSHFRPFVVMFRVFFRAHVLTLFFEGSWPAKWRPGPQLSLVLGHSKTQKVSSRLGETQVFALAAFSAAHSSWLLLGSSWGSSWTVFGPQNEPQIGPEVAQEASQKIDLNMTQKITQNGTPKRRWKLKILAKTEKGAKGKTKTPPPLEVPCLPLVFLRP